MFLVKCCRSFLNLSRARLTWTLRCETTGCCIKCAVIVTLSRSGSHLRIFAIMRSASTVNLINVNLENTCSVLDFSFFFFFFLAWTLSRLLLLIRFTSFCLIYRPRRFKTLSSHARKIEIKLRESSFLGSRRAIPCRRLNGLMSDNGQISVDKIDEVPRESRCFFADLTHYRDTFELVALTDLNKVDLESITQLARQRRRRSSPRSLQIYHECRVGFMFRDMFRARLSQWSRSSSMLRNSANFGIRRTSNPSTCAFL